MASKTTLKRGFKANAERLANQYRKEMGIHPCNPLCAFKLAEHLKVPIYKASEFLTSVEEQKKLAGIETDDSGWSALTMLTKEGNQIIIHNDFHNPARQQSNIMHEIAHIVCDHKIESVNYPFAIPLGMRDFNKALEDEAIYLGATLQLSKPCLLWSLKRKFSIQDISQEYNASEEMVRFRLNTTGLSKRLFS